ncbi:MAG: SDR family oxidoreductase [Gemmataceae bacterium]|nr:SDR family oxidoreductase [Gemmataceae bacterium]
MTDAHVLVVGGSRGLGREFAEMARQQGSRVSTVARSAAEPTPDGHYAFDIRETAGIAPLLSRIVHQRGPLTQLAFFQRFRGSDDDWAGEIGTSLTAVKTFIEQVVSAFDLARPCAIVMVSSVNAQFISPQLPCSYHVAKAGMCQIARYYAVALGGKGIRVNAVCPATFVKPSNEVHYREHPDVYRAMAERSPLKRMGTWKDVADAIFFLLSDKASFITGQSLMVDGGISLQWQETLGS